MRRRDLGGRAEVLESRTLLAAASPWTALAKLPAARGLSSDLTLDAFRPYALDAAAAAGVLKQAGLENVARFGVGRGDGAVLVRVPRPDGSLQRFRVVESAVMDPALAAKFPGIKTYAGVGVDDPAATVRLDTTPLGFHAQVLTPDGAYAVDPYYKTGQSVYASYYTKADKSAVGTPLDDPDLQEPEGLAAARNVAAGRSNGTQLRTFRTAVAATAEYTAYFGGAAAAQAAVVTAINRLSGIYETELAVRLSLVANNDRLIYTNAATDPYTEGDHGAMLNQNRTVLNNVIGAANYDVGHVFSTTGGGVAYVGVVGNDDFKAGGSSGDGTPVGDGFIVRVVAHEFGHQFNAGHSFNSPNGNRDNSAAYEPGGGSTIMSYAGVTDDNLQGTSDPYFNFNALDQINAYIDGISEGTRTPTGNTVPTVSGGRNYTIPANTPFALTATASDPDGDTIYYSWEQADLGPAKSLEDGDDGASPLFRVYNPRVSPVRVFPQLSSILSGRNATTAPSGGLAERLPTTSRQMRFVVTARDRRNGGGGTNVQSSAPVVITSTAAASGFGITNYNTAAALVSGTTVPVTWNVAGTTGNGVNTANVQISLSRDGGETFPVVLNVSTTNDGSENVTLPYGPASSQVRIKVAAIDNIFFDINNANLTLNGGSPVSASPATPDLAAASDTGVSNADNLTNRNNAAAARTLQFTVANAIPGAIVEILTNGVVVGAAVANGTTATVTTNGTTPLPDGVRTFTARQTESGKAPSGLTAGLNVTVDTVAPQVVGTPAFESRFVKPRVTITTTEPVTPAGLAVAKTDAPAGPVAFATAVNGNSVVLNFPASPNGVLPNGTYTLSAPAGGLTDAAGNATTAASSLDFFFLTGDADRNRVVNFDDYVLLQTNFGKTGVDYARGDFDYDGVIDFDDFVLLQTNFGKVV